MTLQGSPYSRFRRALDTCDLALVRTTAAELPSVPLDDALRVCLLLRAEPASYERAVVRWLGRFALERARSVAQVRRAAEVLERLSMKPEAARVELERLCRIP
jgi:hypothetical protein